MRQGRRDCDSSMSLAEIGEKPSRKSLVRPWDLEEPRQQWRASCFRKRAKAWTYAASERSLILMDVD